MAEWRNWSGKQRAEPREIVRPASEGAVVGVIDQARAQGTRIRCVGAAHSHSPLVATEGTLLDLESLAGVVHADPVRQMARVLPATRIFQLGAPLRAAGLALANQGDIDRQAIAGAVATGTHGTGASLRCLSAAVAGVRLALADGSIVDCGPDEEPDLFQAARLGLGALGVVLSLDLALRDAYRLREEIWLEPLEAVLERSAALAASHRHFEFFWFPGREKAVCKRIDETEDPAEYPLAPEGRRCAWSFEVLPSLRPDAHTEMEYSLPAARGPACFREIAELVRTHFPALAWPLEYRTLAADDVWLSMACGRPTVAISVHQDAALDEEPLFRACEEVFLRHEGRPHWGKLHYLDGKRLRERHPRWDDWWRVRDAVDPDGIFLNDFVATLRT